MQTFQAPSPQEGLLHPIVTLLFLHLHDGLTRVCFGRHKEYKEIWADKVALTPDSQTPKTHWHLCELGGIHGLPHLMLVATGRKIAT